MSATLTKSCLGLVPVEVPEPKELSLLIFANVVVCTGQELEIVAQSPSHFIILLLMADAMSTDHQLIGVRVTPSYHHPTIHLGRVECPVRDANKCHSFASLHNL